MEAMPGEAWRAVGRGKGGETAELGTSTDMGVWALASPAWLLEHGTVTMTLSRFCFPVRDSFIPKEEAVNASRWAG